jgi:large subunit ribosomal protein L17
MFRNLLVSLVEHERLKTTLAKAKELRGWADRMVTLGKKGSLHARRRAFAMLRSEEIVKKLFDEIAPRFKDRAGGYTRVYKLGWRPGDNAPLSLIEFVTAPVAGEKKKSAVGKAREALGKVAPKRKAKEEKAGEEKKERKERQEIKPKAEKKAQKEEKPKKEEKAKKEEKVKETPKEKKKPPKKSK